MAGHTFTFEVMCNDMNFDICYFMLLLTFLQQ